MSRLTARAKKRAAIATGDSFQNLISRVGIGQPGTNQAAGGTYGFNPISRNRVVLEQAYRSSWLAGKAVDIYAEDMTREGIDLQSDIEPDKLEALQVEIDRLQVWDKVNDTIKWARLYGGCIAVMLIDGQKPETPLIMDRIGKNQFKGLLVLDRWVVTPSLTEPIKELGPDMGMPMYYDVIADAQGMVNMRIHHSRVIRLDGVELPYWQKIAENGWGLSVLERLWDRLLAFDSTTEGTAQLVYKAHLRTYKVEGLRQIIAGGGKAMEGLVAQINAIRAFQSNEGMTLMDTKDEFETHAYTFAGLSDVILQFGQQLSGAMDIPLVRLFGQSPAGLNSTGESDIRNYYDSIKQQQERKLRSGIGRIYDAVHRSLFGKGLPENFSFKFTPLWQLDENERATVAGQVATAVTGLYDSGIIDRSTALKELRESSDATGIFSNITDEQIKEAEDEPPPSPEGMDPNIPEGPDNDGGGGAPDPSKKVTGDADFREGDHPRDQGGKFTSGGAGSSGGNANASKADYTKGGRDQHGFERAPGLNVRERGIEQSFYNAIRKGETKLIDKYHAANGNVIDPDLVKSLNAEFAENPDLARAVHEPSSYLAKVIYKRALEKKAAEGDTSTTIFTAGGSGSGKSKTTPLAKAVHNLGDDALVYDSTLSSFASAKSRIDAALEITKGDVGIVYTNTDMERALAFNIKRPRSVSIDTLIHAHVGASNTIRELAKHYKDNPRVKIDIFNNRPEGASEGTVADVPHYQPMRMRALLVKKAKGMLERGEITQEKFTLLTR